MRKSEALRFSFSELIWWQQLARRPPHLQRMFWMMEGPPEHRICLLNSVKYAHFVSSFTPVGPEQLPGTPFLPWHRNSTFKERQRDLLPQRNIQTFEKTRNNSRRRNFLQSSHNVVQKVYRWQRRPQGIAHEIKLFKLLGNTRHICMSQSECWVSSRIHKTNTKQRSSVRHLQ